MPRRCCVPGCKSNYDSSLKNGEKPVSTFVFPRDENLRRRWTKAIPRANWQPSKGSFVCCKHFSENEIIRNENIRKSDGTREIMLLRNPKLIDGAVPHIFPDLPQHLRQKRMSRVDPSKRKKVREQHCEKNHQKLQDMKEQHTEEVHQKLQEAREQRSEELHKKLQEAREQRSEELHQKLQEVREQRSEELHQKLQEAREQRSEELHQKLQEAREQRSEELHQKLQEAREQRSEELHQKLQEVREQRYKELQKLQEQDFVKGFQEFKLKISSNKHNNVYCGWNVKIFDSHVYFYTLNIDEELIEMSQNVCVQNSICVDSELKVNVFLGANKLIAKDLSWVLPSSLSLTKWSQFGNLLARYKNLNFVCNDHSLESNIKKENEVYFEVDIIKEEPEDQ